MSTYEHTRVRRTMITATKRQKIKNHQCSLFRQQTHIILTLFHRHMC